MKEKEIRLSPLTRMSLTFDKELNLDKNGVFGRETYEKYIERHRNAVERQDQIARGLFIQNALLFLILSGQTWTLPVIGIQISDIPAIQEILLFSCSLAFYFTCTIFVTSQCYGAIIDQYGNRIVDSSLIDPDFFNASRKHYDLFLKLYRPKLNIWGVDFYQHKRGFAIFAVAMNVIMFAVILAIPAVHLAVVGTASWQVYISDLNVYAKWFLLTATAVINLGGLALVVGMNKDFTFKITEPKADPDKPPSEEGSKPD